MVKLKNIDICILVVPEFQQMTSKRFSDAVAKLPRNQKSIIKQTYLEAASRGFYCPTITINSKWLQMVFDDNDRTINFLFTFENEILCTFTVGKGFHERNFDPFIRQEFLDIWDLGERYLETGAISSGQQKGF